MILSKFDNQCIRLVDTLGNSFEGICTYQDKYFNQQEYDRKEEALKISTFLFYKSDIKELESLENNWGPFGNFSAPYGLLEKVTVEDGIDAIKDVFFSEENAHIYRLLLCLDDFLFENSRASLDVSQVIQALDELLEFELDETSRIQAQHLLERLRKSQQQ